MAGILTNLKAKFKALFRKKSKKSPEEEGADGNAEAAGTPAGENPAAEGAKTDEHAAETAAGEHRLEEHAGEAAGATDAHGATEHTA